MSRAATPPATTGSILALAGGVGGAKLANGLAAMLAPEQLAIIVNTGDDFEHLGLSISPDLDTVTYTLAGINNVAQGWGIAGESWTVLEAIKRLGGEDWFLLGDQDLATHIVRSQRLRSETLSQVTADLCRRLGIRHRVAPMSDDPVRTMVETDEGRLAFQDYFVRRRCAPRFRDIAFDGIAQARPSPAFEAALDDPALAAIVICPSNPILSIRPITSLPGIAERLRQSPVPVVAVSPFIGDKAVKGPAAKIMQELDLPVSPHGVMSCYGDMIDILVIDREDAAYADQIDGVEILVTDTLMRDPKDQARLAGEILEFLRSPRRVTRP
jgi:LPPG:FO 2-phospho-L-lactate transferase